VTIDQGAEGCLWAMRRRRGRRPAAPLHGHRAPPRPFFFCSGRVFLDDVRTRHVRTHVKPCVVCVHMQASASARIGTGALDPPNPLSPRHFSPYKIPLWPRISTIPHRLLMFQVSPDTSPRPASARPIGTRRARVADAMHSESGRDTLPSPRVGNERGHGSSTMGINRESRCAGGKKKHRKRTRGSGDPNLSDACKMTK
jgi:hypothetical protein